MKSKAEKATYDMNYQKNHMSRVTVWFNLDKDKEILEWLNQSGLSKSELIKNALRNEMKRSGESE
jgi:DNA repair ATPase RecN